MTPNRRAPKPIRPKRKSGGPRSAAGKAIASRNALRHGFAAEVDRRAPAPEQIERLAQVIIGDDRDPGVIDQAFKIAENELLLAEIAAHKVSVVERLRELYAVPFATKDNSLELATAKFMEAWLLNREIEVRLPALLKKYEARLIQQALSKPRAAYIASLEKNDNLRRSLDRFNMDFKALVQSSVLNWTKRMSAPLKGSDWRAEVGGIVPVQLKALLEEPAASEESKLEEGDSANETTVNDSERRSEYEALEAAVQDLIRLDRYEQRAWSRQKRAILQLANLKLAARFQLQRS